MSTLISVIESRIDSNNLNNSFVFLEDGEKSVAQSSLSGIRRKSLEISSVLPKNKTVLILLPQGISFIEAFLGCLYARSVAVPTSIPGKNNGSEKLQNIIKDADISFAITNRNILNNLKNWFGDDFFGQIKWFFVEDFAGNEISESFDLPKSDQLAYLQYTSGSTGSPKAVMITHENIIANSKIIQKCFQNDEETVSVCWLPSFHDMGLIDGIIQPVFSNFKSVLMSPIHFLQRPARWFRAIDKFGAKYSGAPNFAFDFCTERIREEEIEGIDLSGLRCLYNGSEPIRTETVRRFVERFSKIGFTNEKIFTCYGLAEATLAVTTSKLFEFPAIINVNSEKLRHNEIELTDSESSAKLIGSGKPICDTKLKIINPETLKECRENEIGEVWVSGKSIAAGYLKRPETTSETFVNFDNSRFLRTGDLGFIHKEELFITGRLKDLIIIRGKNHFPQDIENTVSKSHEALQKNACAAFSIESDSEEKLIVVQEIKRTFLQNVEYQTVFNAILAELSQEHGLRAFDIALIKPASLPKTTSGKIRRNECRNLWQSKKLKILTSLNPKIYENS